MNYLHLVMITLLLSACATQEPTYTNEPLDKTPSLNDRVVYRDLNEFYFKPNSIEPNQLARHKKGENNHSGETVLHKKNFTVKPGSVRSNAERLLKLFGWKIYKWDTDNYPIDYEHEIQFASVQEGLAFLLRQYPIQGQLITVNKSVWFVKRQQPKSTKIKQL